MTEFGLIRPFDIDDGQLDGLRPQECFVLGYELAQVDALLKDGSRFVCNFHAENKDRIEAYARKLGRECRFSWMQGDVSESWLTLESPAKENP
jgi:hypothetical protein